MSRRAFAAIGYFFLAACASAPPSPAPAPQAESAPPAAGTPTTPKQTFAEWVAAFRRDARAQGVDPAVLAAAFDQVRLLPEIIERDSSQAEFTRQIWDYLDTAVSTARVARGRDKLALHFEAAQAAEARYGVPKQILLAIWGMESNYGSNFGDYETIDALATLGYDGRREAFARRQLLAALQILAAGDVPRARLQGSWAGAMGHPQFLPTSYLAYAVDADGDGARDIWASVPDVLGSIAHYLAKAGWRAGVPWGAEVVLPPDFDYAVAAEASLPTAAWAARGVRPARGAELPQFDAGRILVPAGARGPAFLVGPNFKAILRYNNATSYALAVGLLANRIAGAPALLQDWPRAEPAFSRAQIEELQRLLNAAGFDAGTPDGIVGPNTRAALRAYQASLGLTADGFPTHALLRRLRQAAPDQDPSP